MIIEFWCSFFVCNTNNSERLTDNLVHSLYLGDLQYLTKLDGFMLGCGFVVGLASLLVNIRMLITFRN